MAPSLSIDITADNTHGFTRVRVDAEPTARTINLRFDLAPNRSGFRVMAWGEALPLDGGGMLEGFLPRTPEALAVMAQELIDVWRNEVVERHGPSTGGFPGFPFAVPTVELPAAVLDEVCLDLARAGKRLFDILFLGTGQGMRELGGHLVSALRRGPQVISVHADELFVPWTLLYVSDDPQESLQRGDSRASFENFLGYRHLLEHQFRRAPEYRSVVRVDDRAGVSGNVDWKLDEEYFDGPPVSPVMKHLDTNTDLVIRSSKTDLAEAFLDSTVVENVMYFCCHSVMGENQPWGQPEIRLTDGAPIRTSDFIQWLEASSSPLPDLVFLNACQGGRMSGVFCPSLGRELLGAGAGCLLGPQVDLPPVFAMEYALKLFDGWLGGRRLGDLVRSLAVEFIEGGNNPLGLTMMLFRGMDLRLEVGGTP